MSERIFEHGNHEMFEMQNKSQLKEMISDANSTTIDAIHEIKFDLKLSTLSPEPLGLVWKGVTYIDIYR